MDRLRREFEVVFGRRPDVIAEAPGRVNLIGEHTDYNEGFVLPVAINRTVAVAAVRRDVRKIAVRSLDYGECDEFALDSPAPAGGWRDYVRGVAWALRGAGFDFPGAEIAISGDIPPGAGLSSSAAIEVAVAGALLQEAPSDARKRHMALLAQRAENEFVGVQCGIMDQFAAALSRAGHALFIDCRTLRVEHVPLRLEKMGATLVVVDSKVPRRLGEAPYNRRRQECAEAARTLGVSSLRDADETAFGALPEPLLGRARHVVRENRRVLDAVHALRTADLARFGALMYESHASLRDDFEVSCPELDLLVELASLTEGTMGARLTGAGFGGCTVNLVRNDALEGFREQVVVRYRKETGLEAQMHICRAVDGLRVWHV